MTKDFSIMNQGIRVVLLGSCWNRSLYRASQNGGPFVQLLWRSHRFNYLGFYTVAQVRLQVRVWDLVRVNMTHGYWFMVAKRNCCSVVLKYFARSFKGFAMFSIHKRACGQSFRTMPGSFLWKLTLFWHCWRTTKALFLKQPLMFPFLCHKPATTCWIDSNKVSYSKFEAWPMQMRKNRVIWAFSSFAVATQTRLNYFGTPCIFLVQVYSCFEFFAIVLFSWD